MTIEDMIAAKVRLAHFEAVCGLVVSVLFIILGAALFFGGRAALKKSPYSDGGLIAIIAGLAIGGAALVGVCVNTLDYLKADLTARADMANYRLVELKK